MESEIKKKCKSSRCVVVCIFLFSCKIPTEKKEKCWTLPKSHSRRCRKPKIKALRARPHAYTYRAQLIDDLKDIKTHLGYSFIYSFRNVQASHKVTKQQKTR